MDYWGGPKGMLAPPLKLLGGLAPPGPPSSYAYVLCYVIGMFNAAVIDLWSRINIDQTGIYFKDKFPCLLTR